MKYCAKKINIICSISLIISIFIDQFTKYIAQKKLPGNSIPIIKDVFSFTYLENRGVGFGLLQNKVNFILIVNVLVLLVLFIMYLRMPKTMRYLPLHLLFTLIVSGALGNIIDRVRLGYVIDFLYFELIDFPIFNVADIYVTVSVFLLIFFMFFFYKDDELELVFKKDKPVADTEAADNDTGADGDE